MNNSQMGILRNLLTVIFGMGGVGLSAIIPNISPVLGAVIGLWVRAAMDYFWPANGQVTDWKSNLRNFLTVLVASGEGLHAYIPVIPVGVCASLSLVLRAVMDAIWPAQPVGTAPAVSNPAV
jgi:hypothetical protein